MKMFEVVSDELDINKYHQMTVNEHQERSAHLPAMSASGRRGRVQFIWNTRLMFQWQKKCSHKSAMKYLNAGRCNYCDWPPNRKIVKFPISQSSL